MVFRRRIDYSRNLLRRLVMLEVRTARRDVTCYKFFTNVGGKVFGLQRARSSWGSARSVSRKGFSISVPDAFKEILHTDCGPGTHAFDSLNRAIHQFDNALSNYSCARYLDVNSISVWECIIPKGAKYIRSVGWKYRAEKMILKKRILFKRMYRRSNKWQS